MIIFLTSCVNAIRNPSVIYCQESGYTFSIQKTAEGEIGICDLPDGTSVNAWDFLKGKVGTEFNYCSENGYGTKTIKNSEKCSSIYSNECSICIDNENKEIQEPTKLMNLNFKESVCGDNVCNVGENFEICPKDCKSGSEDGYCDGIKDNICDLDCKLIEDLDCEKTNIHNFKVTEKRDLQCIYDGKCYSECIHTDDIDCKCIDSKSRECQIALNSLKRKGNNENLFQKLFSWLDNLFN